MGAKYIDFGELSSFVTPPLDKLITIINAESTISLDPSSAAKAPPDDAPIAIMRGVILLPSSLLVVFMS